MNIFLRELKAHRKSLIIWSVGMILLIITGMAKYTSLYSTGSAMQDVLNQMPKSVKVVLGMADFDVTKVSGFYGMLFLYIILMTTVHAAMIGAGIISKEERDKTSEFLFAKPVSRDRVISAKLLAAFFNIVVLNIVTTLTSIAIVNKYSNGEQVNGMILTLMLGMFFMQLIFMFIGTGLAAASRNPKTAASAATGILLGTFVIAKAVDLNSGIDFLKYITPFKYFDPVRLILGPGFEPVYIILTVVIVAVLFVATYRLFKKRDLKI